MSWFDEQPQPPTRLGITDPGQGGRVPTTEIGFPGAKLWANYNPGYQQSGFLPGDEVGPDGMPLNGQGWPFGQSQPQGAEKQPMDLQAQIRKSYADAHGGAEIPADVLAYYTQKASGQEQFSDGHWGTGWNDYWAARMNNPTSASADPKLSYSLFGEPIAGGGSSAGTSGTIGSLAGNGGGMADGSLIQPWNEQFQAPSMEQIQQDPSYQFQLQQGMQGIERGAASKGTLLTGGTLKSLNQFGQGLASTFSDKYYNRAMGEYGLKKQNFYDNQDRPFTKLSQLASLGKPQTMQPPTG